MHNFRIHYSRIMGRIQLIGWQRPWPGPFTERRLQTLHKQSFRNRLRLVRANIVGCFWCMRVFPPTLIREWIDQNETALCPKCGIDSVIPTKSCTVLDAMYSYWFDRGTALHDMVFDGIPQARKP